MFWVWWCGQNGVVVAWVEAKNDEAGRRFFNAEALGTDRHPAVRADLKGRAHAPDVIPPGAKGSWAKGGTFFLPGLIPCV